MDKKFKPVNMPVLACVLFQAGVAAQLIWGWVGNAWTISWICSYIAVMLIVEAGMYNAVVNRGKHPIKSLYGIIIMIGFAFFFCAGFLLNGWSFCWISLVAAAVAVVIIIPIDISVSRKYEAEISAEKKE